jgi:hypothetical protein
MKLTKDESMTIKAREFEAAMEALRAKFYDMPAPESDGLTWGHVGDAGRIVCALNELIA